LVISVKLLALTVASMARSSAAGTPAPPKPLIISEAPSSIPASAASAVATRLSIMPPLPEARAA
jgi:hypothetical protein